MLTLFKKVFSHVHFDDVKHQPFSIPLNVVKLGCTVIPFLLGLPPKERTPLL